MNLASTARMPLYCRACLWALAWAPVLPAPLPPHGPSTASSAARSPRWSSSRRGWRRRRRSAAITRITWGHRCWGALCSSGEQRGNSVHVWGDGGGSQRVARVLPLYLLPRGLPLCMYAGTLSLLLPRSLYAGAVSLASLSSYCSCPPSSPPPLLCRSCQPGLPVQLLQLPFTRSEDLYFVLVNPVFEAPTAEMRAVLPKMVPMKSMINNCCQGGSLVRGCEDCGPEGQVQWNKRHSP